MSAIMKIFVAALAAGAVHALPSNMGSSSKPDSTSSGAPPAATQDPNNNDLLIAKLKTAPTAIKRFQDLVVDGDKLKSEEELADVVVFDFNNAPATGNGGALKAANIDNFPILTDLGIATTVGFLSPCGLNTPHIHPRATEFLTVVEGGNLDFGWIPENNLVKSGSSEITGTLDKFQGTVFPIGSIHWQFNNNCDNTTFVATLNKEDPGTSQMAQNFFGLTAGIVNATLGFPEQLNGADIEQFRAQIPANLALGVDKCLQKCHISKR